jgi:hypothetical protein
VQVRLVRGLHNLDHVCAAVVPRPRDDDVLPAADRRVRLRARVARALLLRFVSISHGGLGDPVVGVRRRAEGRNDQNAKHA